MNNFAVHMDPMMPPMCVVVVVVADVYTAAGHIGQTPL